MDETRSIEFPPESQATEALLRLQAAAHGGDALLMEAADELAALRKDAARYRWLRAQHWNTAELCVVMDPKDAVKLGRTCPSGEYLDIAVDDAMLIGRAVGAA